MPKRMVTRPLRASAHQIRETMLASMLYLTVLAAGPLVLSSFKLSLDSVLPADEKVPFLWKSSGVMVTRGP